MAKQSLLAVVALLLGALFATIPKGAQSIGVCYGKLADNLPPPSEVVQIYKSNGIDSMRIYYADKATLQALNGSNIRLIMDVGNANLASLAASPSAAAEWVQKNVVAFPGVSFRYIAVGNEAINSGADARTVLSALRNIEDALSQADLSTVIKVSTAVSSGAALTASFPPSAGNFSSYMIPIVKYLASRDAPLLTNLYPYFAVNGSQTIDVGYALFNSSPTTWVRDAMAGYVYTNLFDALVDAYYTALERAGVGNVAIVVSETGWPSAGGAAATTSNALMYNQNLISHIRNEFGTPKRPGGMETYIFSMFNENRRHGDDWEKHFGLFNPDKSSAYPEGSVFAPTATTPSPSAASYGHGSPWSQVTKQSQSHTTIQKRLIIVLTTSAAVGVIVAILASIWFCRKPPSGTEQVLDGMQEEDMCSQEEDHINADEEEGSQDEMSCQLYSYHILEAATCHFSNTNKLGSGGFGTVYKGTLENGKEVAVKWLKDSKRNQQELEREISIVVSLRHTNILRFLGYCFEGERRLLVYEYAPNNSLDKFLYKASIDQSHKIDWTTWFNIIKGVARGLRHLHDQRIIHRDLKPQNVLLDENFNPKIADFDLMRMYNKEITHESTTKVAGTYGYMAPECTSGPKFQLSIKSDVYSYGVLVLEIITRRKIHTFEGQNSESLVEYVWKHWTEKKASDVVEGNLEAEGEEHALRQALRCMHIALLCVQSDRRRRPTMGHAIAMLRREEMELQQPSLPGYVVVHPKAASGALRHLPCLC